MLLPGLHQHALRSVPSMHSVRHSCEDRHDLQESGHCSGGMVITINVGVGAPGEAPAPDSSIASTTQAEPPAGSRDVGQVASIGAVQASAPSATGVSLAGMCLTKHPPTQY